MACAAVSTLSLLDALPILLAVITFMAVTFLLVSHTEKGAVEQQMQQKTAEFAADAALERAKVEMIARMLAFTNPYSSGLLVSDRKSTRLNSSHITNPYAGF